MASTVIPVHAKKSLRTRRVTLAYWFSDQSFAMILVSEINCNQLTACCVWLRLP